MLPPTPRRGTSGSRPAASPRWPEAQLRRPEPGRNPGQPLLGGGAGGEERGAQRSRRRSDEHHPHLAGVRAAQDRLPGRPRGGGGGDQLAAVRHVPRHRAVDRRPWRPAERRPVPGPDSRPGTFDPANNPLANNGSTRRGFIQWIAEDQVVPNPTTVDLIQAVMADPTATGVLVTPSTAVPNFWAKQFPSNANPAPTTASCSVGGGPRRRPPRVRSPTSSAARPRSNPPDTGKAHAHEEAHVRSDGPGRGGRGLRPGSGHRRRPPVGARRRHGRLAGRRGGRRLGHLLQPRRHRAGQGLEVELGSAPIIPPSR